MVNKTLTAVIPQGQSKVAVALEATEEGFKFFEYPGVADNISGDATPILKAFRLMSANFSVVSSIINNRQTPKHRSKCFILPCDESYYIVKIISDIIVESLCVGADVLLYCNEFEMYVDDKSQPIYVSDFRRIKKHTLKTIKNISKCVT